MNMFQILLLGSLIGIFYPRAGFLALFIVIVAINDKLMFLKDIPFM